MGTTGDGMTRATGDGFVTGTVVTWWVEDGWGVVESPELAGTVFVHFSAIRDQDGFRSLTAGQTVRLRWEWPGQDGCAYRATDVRVGDGPPTPDRPPVDGSAYRSSLTITFDDAAPPA